jgi:hypothetical protein
MALEKPRSLAASTRLAPSLVENLLFNGFHLVVGGFFEILEILEILDILIIEIRDNIRRQADCVSSQKSASSTPLSFPS